MTTSTQAMACQYYGCWLYQVEYQVEVDPADTTAPDYPCPNCGNILLPV